MTGQLEGHLVLITGGAQGMGAAIARKAADEGAAGIGILDRADAEPVVAELRERGVTAVYVPVDLRDREATTAAVDRIAEELGGLDTVFNNAGIVERAFTNDVDFDTIPEDLWDMVLDINLNGTWIVSRAAAPHLKKSTRGPAIVNAASVAGKVAYSHTAYGVSKAGIIQLTKSMAMTLAPDIRVNCYCPGPIETAMSSTAVAAVDMDVRVKSITSANLLPRMGRPEEVADLACFLAGDRAGYITGSSYDIDGGTLAWRGQRED